MIYRSILTSLFVGLVILATPTRAQEKAQEKTLKNGPVSFVPLTTGSTASLRGLCVVSSQVVWASGSGGKVLRSIDGGKSWTESIIPDCEEIEFRDIEGFDKNHAVILGAGSPGRIYSTNDGGKSWTLRYENRDKRIFFDAFDFPKKDFGIAFSDPLDGQAFLLVTHDRGLTWKQLPTAPKTLKNEAGFAASGTCLIGHGSRIWIGLGGKPDGDETTYSRVLRSFDSGKTWTASLSTFPRSESAGIFSMVHVSNQHLVAVGGDYLKPDLRDATVSISKDGGKTWSKPTGSGPAGYRSGLAASTVHLADEKRDQTILVATGTNGTDVSYDGGNSWVAASKTGFHAIEFVPGTRAGFASGGDGRIARFSIRIKD